VTTMTLPTPALVLFLLQARHLLWELWHL